MTLVSLPLYSNTTLVSFFPTIANGGTVMKPYLVDEVREELVARVAVDAVGRVEQAQCRRCDDRLLDRQRRELPRGAQQVDGVRGVAKRPAAQHGQLAGVPVGERHDRAARRQVGYARHRVGQEARLVLLAVGDHRRAGGLEPADRVRQRLVRQLPQTGGVEPALRVVLEASQELRGTRDAADRLGRNAHGVVVPLDAIRPTEPSGTTG